MNEHETLRQLVYGTSSHVHALHALEGLELKMVGATPVGQHSIFQLLQHMVYWQEIGLARIRGEQPAYPAHAAEGWAARPAPTDGAEWNTTLDEFATGLRELEGMLEDQQQDLDRVVDPKRGSTARQNILMIMGHNSYHLGQIVLLRQELGAWPPPKGGDTW